MTDFAVAVPLEAEHALVVDAARYGHLVVLRCSGADELAARLAAARPAAALVAALPQYLSAAVVDACDAAGVRLFVTADGPDQQRHARALGVVDAYPGPPAWATLHSGVPQRDEQTSPSATGPVPGAAQAPPPAAAPTTAPERRGVIITVWGSAGAPGRTSIAIALAAELAATGRTVALADADTHAASVDPALGLLGEAPGFAAACRLAGTGALTVSEFERVAERVGSGHGGFWVLTGLGRPNRWPELSAQRIATTLQIARAWVDVLVVDVAASIEQDEEIVSDLAAPRRNAATITALREADHVIAVGAADPIGLARYLRAHAELVETIAPGRITTVVNKVRAGAIGLQPAAQIAQTLGRFGGIDRPVLVPWDPAAFDAAVLGGRPLPDAAPRSPARLAIRELARELLPSPDAGRPRRRSRPGSVRERLAWRA